MIYSPLEQFTILSVYCNNILLYLYELKLNIIIIGMDNKVINLTVYMYNIINIFISFITNISIFISLLIGFFYFFKKIIFKFSTFTLKDFLIIKIYNFLYDMLIQQIHHHNIGINILPYIIYIFILLLLSNLIGMFPFGLTITAQIAITFFCAFSINFGLLIFGIFLNKKDFFALFNPKGTPKLLQPLIIIIEIVSYSIRSFSLSIRSFANMMAGHCLLYVISSFMFSLSNISTLIFYPIFGVIYTMIFILEFSIAILQAYVFTILVCIYYRDALYPIH